MTTGGIKAADAFLFASLTALSASWPRREAGRCPGRHQRAWCTANPRLVGNVLLHSGQLCGRSRASTSTSVDTGSRYRVCTCMPFDLGADISIEADVLEPLASAETRSEASAAVQSSRPTSSAYSSLLAVTSPREGPPMPWPAMSCSLKIRSNPSVKHCGLKISLLLRRWPSLCGGSSVVLRQLSKTRPGSGG